ncbi:hypothetical protein WJX73_000811 [Symbiochloris irregularis]|uniref:Uncharacterized protein n=1 Tax=Symbiochloris irregularis TaxID=706552 RepID=A0AAW1PJ70_9CHLO
MLRDSAPKPEAAGNGGAAKHKKPRKSLKTKATGSQDAERGAEPRTAQAQSSQAVKKTKKPKPKAQHKEESELKQRLAQLSAADQATWLQHEYTIAGKASFVEAEALSEPHILALPYEGSLEERIQAAEDDWERLFCGKGSAGAPNGAPTLLFVTPSSILANQLVKHLRTFRKACRVAKLFSKHMKRLSLIVLDVGMDLKQRTIFDIPEVSGDFWELLRKHLAVRLEQHGTKLALVDASYIAKDGQEKLED